MSEKNEKIDLVGFVNLLWLAKKRIIVFGGVFAMLGVGIALLTQNRYSASSVFIPQVSDSESIGGNLGGLASLAGINLGGGVTGSADFPPSLYPNILNNVHFKLSLLEAPLVPQQTGDTVTYREYFEHIYQPSALSTIKKYTIGLPGVIIGAIKGEKSDESTNGNVVARNDTALIKLTKIEREHFSRIENQVSIISNLKDGFVTISVTMPDPYLAAQLAKYVEFELEKALVSYKIKNAEIKLEYIQARYDEKKKDFENIEDQLAIFKDRNKNLNTARAQTQLQRLESRYDLTLGVYLNLAQELEQAKLHVNKSTPIMSIIQPVTVPSIKSGPSRALIVIMFALIGGLFIPLKIYIQTYILVQIKRD